MNKDDFVKHIMTENLPKITSYTVFEPRIEPGCGYGPVVKCEIKFENGKGKSFNLITKLYSETGGKRAVIVAYWNTIIDLE